MVAEHLKAPLTCAFCGSTVLRSKYEIARGQRYCSPRCQRIGRVPDPEQRDVEPAFGYWFSGLVDGEGSFLVYQSRQHAVVRFSLSLRADDRPLLEEIIATLGIGSIYRTKPNQQTVSGKLVHPKDVLQVNSFKECRILVAVLDQYPLRSKKRRDYAVWREALLLLGSGAPHLQLLRDHAKRIKQVREYAEPT